MTGPREASASRTSRGGQGCTMARPAIMRKPAGRRSAGGPCPTAQRELIVARHERAVVVRPFRRQRGEGPLDLAPDPADRDAEDALAALHQVDDLIGGRALVDRRTVAHQGDLRQVLDAALAQVRHGGPDLLQRDTGVQQSLDDLQDQDVAKAVQTLRPGAAGRPDGRFDQPGAGPVVQLAVGDARGTAGRRPAVARRRVQIGQLVAEQEALGALWDGDGLVDRLSGAAHGTPPSSVATKSSGLTVSRKARNSSTSSSWSAASWTSNPDSASTCRSHSTGLPVRTATAIASEARESIRRPSASTSAAWNTPSTRATISTRSSVAATVDSTDTRRSWVIGRGGTTPACPAAMACPSESPTTIGSTRPPSTSSRSTTTWSRGTCRRTPRTCISIRPSRIAPRYVPDAAQAHPLGPIGRRANQAAEGRCSERQVRDAGPHEGHVELRTQLADLPRHAGGIGLCRNRALAAQRGDDLLDHVHLAVGRRAERSQVPRLDTVLGEGDGQQDHVPRPGLEMA